MQDSKVEEIKCQELNEKVDLENGFSKTKYEDKR